MNLRVRVTNIRPVGFSTVVEFAPVLAYEPGRCYTTRTKHKDGTETVKNEWPKAHGGHDIAHDHRWTVEFPVAAKGMVPGKISYEEEVEEVGPDEVLRRRMVTRSKPGLVEGVIIDEALAQKVSALQPGFEYDVVGHPSVNSTFTPVVHA